MLYIAYITDGKPILNTLLGLLIQRAGQWDDLWFIACFFIVDVIYFSILRVIRSTILRLM